MDIDDDDSSSHQPELGLEQQLVLLARRLPHPDERISSSDAMRYAGKMAAILVRIVDNLSNTFIDTD